MLKDAMLPLSLTVLGSRFDGNERNTEVVL